MASEKINPWTILGWFLLVNIGIAALRPRQRAVYTPQIKGD